MFKLAKQATYWWPVTFRQPSPSAAGSFVDAAFEVEYRYLTVDDHLALMKEVNEKKLTDRQVAPRIVQDFRGIEDDAGQMVVFSPAELDKLTNVPGVDAAIVRAYFASRSEAAEKN